MQHLVEFCVIIIVRSYKFLKTKYVKVQSHIKFIKSCKEENLKSTFARVNLAIKSGRGKLKLL